MLKRITGAGLLALTLGLAGCTPGQTGTAAPGGTPFRVTIPHKYGATTLEKVPVRVVTVGLVDQDAFVALGTVPVATREWYGKVPGALFPWAKAKAGDAPLPEVLDYELNYEKIVALKPDLIVGLYSGLTQEEYDTLSKIAPTVAQPAGQPDWSADWRTITTTVGTILNKTAEAKNLIQGVEDTYAAVRKAHPEFAQKSAVLLSNYGWPATFFAYSYNGGLLRFLTDLGFQPLPELVKQAGDKTGLALSRERFDLVDADLVLWNLTSADGLASVQADPAFRRLSAVKEGRVIFYAPGQGGAYDAMVFASVLSLPAVTRDLADDFARALDRDPATPSLGGLK